MAEVEGKKYDPEAVKDIDARKKEASDIASRKEQI